MKIVETNLKDCFLIKPEVFSDDRGNFAEVFDEQYDLFDLGNFIQDNVSVSKANVFRGMHIQLGQKQGKLLTCIEGIIADFVIDLRPASKTYKQWYATILYGIGKDQIYVPPGFAHGFYSYVDNTIVHYKTTELYNKSQERTLFWEDEKIGIDYSMFISTKPILSTKDHLGLSFTELEKEL